MGRGEVSPFDKIKDEIEEKKKKIEEKAKEAANEALADIKTGKPKKIAKWIVIAFVILFFLFIIIGSLISSIARAECGPWLDTVIGHEFISDVDGTVLHVKFGAPIYGPCPMGQVTVTWDGLETPAIIPYSATPEFIFIEDLRFVLVGQNALVYLPEDQFIILQKVSEPNPPVEY